MSLSCDISCDDVSCDASCDFHAAILLLKSVAFVEPSITTFTNVNPGFCISVIDGIHSNSTHVRDRIKVKWELRLNIYLAVDTGQGVLLHEPN